MQVPDKCSFEWAKKLQDAGFVPPAYAPGQIWYDKLGRPTIIANVWPSGIMNTANLKTGAGGRVMHVPEGSVYAPGVSELMISLPDKGYGDGPSVWHNKLNNCFLIESEYDEIHSLNLCDVLAEAWIESRKGVPV